MKKGPVILIIVLVITAMFMVGMQYGKRVEKANKTISAVLSITPTILPSPIDEPAAVFSKYEHEGCGIGFTKPVQFKASKESTLGAILAFNKQIIAFECPNKQISALENSKEFTATSSVILKNKKIQGYTEGQNVRFIADHPYKKTPIIFSIDNNLLPLIESSLEFTQ